MNQSEFFFSLTAEVVASALADAGFDLTGSCMALNSFENRVYDLGLRDGNHVVAKFYRPGRWTPDQILEEHTFLYDLRSAEIPVCVPFVFPDGTSLRSTPEGIWFAVWPRTGGRPVDEPSDDDYGRLGRLLGRIHNVGASRPAPGRLTLTPEDFVLAPLDFLMDGNFLPAHCRDRYLTAGKDLALILGRGLTGIPFHRIHGDCHLNNLLNGREGWFFLDFDDFLNGPAVQDIWLIAGGQDKESERQRSLFLEGYRLFREFDIAWLRLIEPLRAARFVRYASWIAQRWEDPAFPAAFPHFGTVEYWEKETEDLEKQLSKIRAGEMPEDEPSSVRPERTVSRGDQETALSNKDYFWDWDK
jgi:Ser/Thr protein kinase RdoA (MazF antagonist)